MDQGFHTYDVELVRTDLHIIHIYNNYTYIKASGWWNVSSV